MKKGIALILLIHSLVFAISPALRMCTETGEGTPATAVKVWTTSITTIHNIFPIKIGGVTVLNFGGLEDFGSVSNMPLCVCQDPFPRVGVKISLWEPIAFLEVTKIPSCSPSLGITIPPVTPYGNKAFGGQDEGGEDQGNRHSYQFHFIKFNPFLILGQFLDFVCLEKSGSGLDLAYVSEIDPLWQFDVWSVILNPEAILVANPIAQLACMADSTAANLGFPLDILWWCLGSWGSLYPFTKTVTQGINLSSQMAISMRAVAKLHRQLILWGSVGESGLCGTYPMPIMMKSQYSLLPLHPVVHPNRIPVGRSVMLWGYKKEIPYVNRHVYVNALYRKRDCCAF